MSNTNNLFQFLLRLGDDNLIAGQRMAEWCSRGPILEEDLAMVNVSLDYFGQAESFFDYAAETATNGTDADGLAFGRSERDYYNRLLVEQPNGDFAFSMVKMLFFSTYQREVYLRLSKSADSRIAAIASKAVKEARYHFRHAGDWMIRLGQGTEESHQRAQYALNELTPFVENLFETDELHLELQKAGIAPDMNEVKDMWYATVNAVLANAGLTMPEGVHMFRGGINGYHTEHLGHLLCEMQYLHHAHPGAKW